ncbi:hypothetical protein F8388_020107 [Cannabis sativa]|uniref:Uncharacterized protein n=1 Tax=Cannabis sativa TaxID=3483 RepID=A0A7J6F7W3_CANSA|nr:hypothetical protein F8388_020107 [Cannabis sativa]KAF4402234.1 hypothetical protein G4B88_017746 [Cannabis sativa]
MLKMTICKVPYGSSHRCNPCRIHNNRELVQAFPLRGFKTNHLIGLSLSNINTTNTKIMHKMTCNSVDPAGAASGGGTGAPWNSFQGWVLGLVISLILPFYRNKWGPLLSIKRKVDMAVNTVEAVAEAVEKVAEKVEDIADDIADNLPDNGKLKDAVLFIEKVAHETAKDAHLLDDFIEKVEELEEKVESFLEGSVQEDEAEKEETKTIKSSTGADDEDDQPKK